MLKRTLLKGTVVLAASAAAALSACGNSGTNGDGGGEGGLGGSATGGSSTGGATTGGGTSTGGTQTGGNSNPGGNGGEGGEGGAPPVLETAQDYVDYYCPEGTSAYTITEGDETANDYNVGSVTSPVAYVTWGGADEVFATGDTQESSIRHPLCVIAGSGNDYLEVGGSSSASNAGGFYGSVPTATFVGGDGADVVEYTASTSDFYSGYYRPPFVFKDFKSGVDQIKINSSSASVNTTYATDGVAFIDNFTSSSSAEYSSTNDWALVVDPTDGEIWLSAYNEGVQTNVLIGKVEGDTLEEADVILLLPPT